MISAVICVFFRYCKICFCLQVFAFKGQNITFTMNVLLTRILYSVTPGPAMIRAVCEYNRLILITVVIFVLLRFPSEMP